MGCGPAQSPPLTCTKCNSGPPINGQCTNFMSFSVAAQLPVHSKGLIGLFSVVAIAIKDMERRQFLTTFICQIFSRGLQRLGLAVAGFPVTSLTTQRLVSQTRPPTFYDVQLSSTPMTSLSLLTSQICSLLRTSYAPQLYRQSPEYIRGMFNSSPVE